MRLFRFVAIFSFIIFINGCASVPKEAPAPVDDSMDLQQVCNQHDIICHLDSVSQVVTLSRGDFRAKGMVGSDVIVIGQEKITLSGPLRRVHGSIVAPPDFQSKVIESFSGRVEVSAPKYTEIIVDAGHGGKDPGAQGRSGLQEKDVVLDISKRIKKNLEKRGVKVKMTRSKDEFITLEERTRIASRSKASLFVSIHANSSRARNAKGMEIYYLRELDSAEKKEAQIRENQKTLFKQYAMKQDSPVLNSIVSDMMYTYKREESEKLARFVNRQAANSVDTHDRGSKEAAFFVLRNTLIPAILVEVGFLTNAQEERLLKSASYRQKIADALSESLMKYANSESY